MRTCPTPPTPPRLLWVIAFAVFTSILFPQSWGAEKTSVLFTGVVEIRMGGGPYWHLEHDPFFEVTPVRAFWRGGGDRDDKVIAKALRLYMPRRYEELLENYDVVSLFYANGEFFTAQHAKWISDAVEQGGKGLTLAGHGALWAYDWVITTVGDVLPIQMTSSQFTYDQPTRIKIVNPDHPVTSSLPWSSIGEHGVLAGHSFAKAKEGTEVLADLAPVFGPSHPFLAWWDVGQGRSIAMMSVFWTGYNPFIDWEWFPDYIRNLNLYAAGRELPPDPEIIHLVGIELEKFHLMRGMLVSTIEFVSKLGGNPTQVEQIMSQADGRLGEVERLYLNYDFEGSLKLVGDSIADLGRAESHALELKDRTLFWIYAIEWSVLTSTSLVMGVVIWALMVKRRLYVEVRTTRLAKTGAAMAYSALGGRQDD